MKKFIIAIMIVAGLVTAYNAGVNAGYSQTLEAFRKNDMEQYVLNEMSKELYQACGADSYCRDVF